MHKKICIVLCIIIVLIISIFGVIKYKKNLEIGRVEGNEEEWGKFLRQFDDLLNPEKALNYEDMMKLIKIVYNNNTSPTSTNGIVYIEFNYTVFDLTDDTTLQALKNRIKPTENYKLIHTPVVENNGKPKLEKIVLTNYYE